MCGKNGLSRLESISRLKLSYARAGNFIRLGLETSHFLTKFRPAQGDIKEAFLEKVRIVLDEPVELTLLEGLTQHVRSIKLPIG